MCQWIESIALNNGVLENLHYHQKRLNTTLSAFGSTVAISLNTLLNSCALPQVGYFKVRLLYSTQGVEELSWSEYTPHVWGEFYIVHTDDLSYNYKSSDRFRLEQLKEGLGDVEVIIIKEGLVTDTTYSNVIFHRSGEWFTPSNPLLNGTQRDYLLEHGKIKEVSISVEDLTSYDSFKMINAMMPFEEAITYDICQIKNL